MPTPSPDRVRAVLDDLYALDPALRDYGPDLEEAVRTLLAAKPTIDINPQFAATLRRRLTTQATEPVAHISFMQKFSASLLVPTFAVATVAVVAAVVVTNPALMGLPTGGKTPSNSQTLAFAGLTVTRAGDHGFGDLATQGGGMGGDSISARPQSGGGGGSFSTGMGGGGSAPAIAVAPPMAPLADGATAEQDKRMAENSVSNPGYAPEDYVYERPRYNYDGALPELASSVDVFRRVKRPLGDIGSSLGSASLGFLDLSKFAGSRLQQFTVTQPGPYGYQVYVDLNEGVVSINQDWTTWPQQTMLPCVPEGPCGGQIAATDVPDNNTIIGIADAFLAEKGIKKDGYGAAVVDSRWSIVQPYMRESGQLTADLKVRWAPESMNIVYPLQINGMTAYDSSGFPYGLSVTVNLREKKVSSVWNINSLQYESSSYDAMTDVKAILDIAARGDVYSMPFGQQNERITEQKLGEPTVVLMQSWHQTSGGMGEEILVPALRFPIVKNENPTGNWYEYRDAIMVPLVKELAQPVYSIMEKRTGDGMGGGVSTGGVATPPPASNMPMATEPAPAVAPKADIKE